MSKRIGVLTSGGDAPGMNAAIRAVVRTIIFHGGEAVGIKKGFKGLINNWHKDLTVNSVSGIIHSGGTILQTSRSVRFMEKKYRAKAYENIRKMGLDGLIVIGGDGSFRGLEAIIKEHGIKGIGIPATIDNDLYGTEFTIGFDTAINTAVDAVNKIRDTASSHSRLFIVEVMGKHAGYIAIYSGVASGAEEVFIPETEDNIPLISEKLKQGYKRGKQSSILIVAEGDESGGAFALKEQIKPYLKNWEIRVSILGHFQRGGSPTAIDRLVASRLGVEAVEAILHGKSRVMVGYHGLDMDVTYIPLSDTWKKKKAINDKWLEAVKVLGI